MDSRRAKRRRYNGGQYEQLHDDTDSLRSSIIRRRDNEGRSVLCDRCWSAHIRRRATKRCMNCKQNLCAYCAKMDESRRRSWWPSLLISCWRFLFLKAFRRHTIVDLERVANTSEQNASDKERTHSLTRNETPRSSYSRSQDERYEQNRGRGEVNSTNNYNEGTPHLSRPQCPRHGQRRYYCPNAQALYRAYSFDKHLNKRKNGDRHLRRTRSAERLPNKDFVDRESDFRDLYHQNWEREPFDFHRAHVVNNPGQKQTPGGEDNRKAANKENARPNEQPPVHENNERRFKRGKTSRRGIKHVADIFPETEKPPDSDNNPKVVTSDSPFQRDGYSSQRDGRDKRQHDKTEPNYQGNTATPAEEHLKESDPVTPYIVEEPPDSCPVCLDNIPCRQARRLHCSHSIHTSCLIDLLNKMEFDFGVKCPICNQITHIRNYYMARHMWYKELPVVMDC